MTDEATAKIGRFLRMADVVREVRDENDSLRERLELSRRQIDTLADRVRELLIENECIKNESKTAIHFLKIERSQIDEVCEQSRRYQAEIAELKRERSLESK